MTSDALARLEAGAAVGDRLRELVRAVGRTA
jgi:hypothetical protein